MNLFIISSWYPSNTNPNAGVFVREQAEAIAMTCSDIRVLISAWGHTDSELSVRHPIQAFHVLLWRFRQPERKIHQKNGVWEIFHPSLNFSEKLPRGGTERLISANRKNLLAAIEKFGPIDLIHAHVSYPAGFVASRLSEEFGIPYVLTEHMGPFPFISMMKSGIPRREIFDAFKKAARSIAVSPALAQRISSFGLLEPMVVPNVVNEKKFFNSPIKSDRFIFFTLCNLVEQKGIDVLLRAIALWSPQINEVEFRIGGDGEMLNIYKMMAENLGISNRITWLGKVHHDDASSLFRECHSYVMPSRHETFGVVLAEAIASGKPVIATRCGGPDFIVNSQNGILVDIDSVEQLADAMAWMKENWSEFDPLVIRQEFESRFSRMAVANQLRDIYRTVLES